MPPKQLLRIENLKTYFDTFAGLVKAVDGVSIELNEGETLGLVGESGSGKSVTALSILRIVPRPGKIIAGKILYKGENLLTKTENEMQKIRGKEIGYIVQDPSTSLNPVLTVADQLTEVIRRHQHITKTEALEKAIDLFRLVEIPDPEIKIWNYPHQLSGGMKQRMAVARALSCQPSLLLADEPTTNLDVTIQAQILSLFKALQKKRKMSLLYITHDLGVVANIADRIYVMYAGIIAEHGIVSHIFQNPAHPYTIGLLNSLPNRDKRGTLLNSIPGIVPDPSYKPAGCPFHPRCEHAIDSCRIQFPEICDYGEGHLSRCPVLFAKRKNKIL